MISNGPNCVLGEVLPDIVRLQKLADQPFLNGKKPNLNWLVTGEGEMLRDPEKAEGDDRVLRKISLALQQIPKEKMDAILTLLD